MANKKWNWSEKELRQKYEELGSMLKVAEDFGVSKRLVLNYMNRFGIDRIKKDTEGRVAKIKELAKKNKTSLDIADELGITSCAVNRHCKKHSIKIKRYHKGWTETDSGYILIRFPEHPKSDSKGYVREHILVVEKRLRRYLTDDEVVHHKDRQKDNNEPSNLAVMTRFDHRSLHSREPRKRKYSKDLL